MSVICIVGIIFSRQFVGLVADGFSPEKAALATTLTQIMFPFILLVALAAVAMGAELWKIHATATYVTWYYPFLLIGFLCGDRVSDGRHV